MPSHGELSAIEHMRCSSDDDDSSASNRASMKLTPDLRDVPTDNLWRDIRAGVVGVGVWVILVGVVYLVVSGKVVAEMAAWLP